MDKRFCVKLEELREECERFMLSVDGMDGMDTEELKSRAEQIKSEEMEHIRLLRARCGGGDADENGFCAMQLEELERLADMCLDLEGGDTSLAVDEEEAAALCAEYAIDGAVSAIRRACINALKTVAAQKRGQ